MIFSKDYVRLCSNELPAVSSKTYSAIIGEQPSQGARSPALWNKSYQHFGISCEMVPLDVKQENLADLFRILEREESFTGGAIAAPYKELVWELCGTNVTDEAATIGSINCLFRSNTGELWGTNTDGEGALAAIRAFETDISSKRILQLGAGGTGKAVASYLAGALADRNQLTIVSRSESASKLSRRLSCQLGSWQHIMDLLPSVDLVVNCTSLGDRQNAGHSPLSAGSLATLPSSAKIFDVVYDPPVTELARLSEQAGLKTMNGKKMNLEQAVIGFSYATGLRRESELHDIGRAMMS